MNFTTEQIVVLEKVIENHSQKMRLTDSGKEIKPKNAAIGKLKFKKLMVKKGIDSPLKGFTKSVTFDIGNFLNWVLNSEYKMQDNTKVDEIRVFFARYSNDFLDEPGFEIDNIGRLSVIFSAYLKDFPATYTPSAGGADKLIPEFNLGGLKP